MPSSFQTEKLKIVTTPDWDYNDSTTKYFLRTAHEENLIATINLQHLPPSGMDRLLGRARTHTNISVSIESHLVGAAIDALVSHLADYNSLPIPADSKLQEEAEIKGVMAALLDYAVKSAHEPKIHTDAA